MGLRLPSEPTSTNCLDSRCRVPSVVGFDIDVCMSLVEM
jgi:hypothetical protein